MAEFLDNYNFEVKIGLISMSFSKVTNISSSAEYEAVGEGGINDRVHLLPKPKRAADTIIFEKGIKKGLDDQLNFLIHEGVRLSSIMIIVKQNGSMQRIFWIDEGYVTKKSIGDLDAERGAVLIRTLELAHTGLVELVV